MWQLSAGRRVYAGWLVDLGAKTADDDAQGASEGVSQQFDSSAVDARLADHSPYRWPAAISIGTKRPSTR